MASLWSYWRHGGMPKQKFDTVGGMSSYAVELTKRSPTAPLTGAGSETGTLRVDLSWRMRSSTDFDRSARSAFWRRPLEIFKPAEIQGHSQGVASIDFDLACLYELKDGSRGVVQSLGDLLGDFGAAPYIKLSGDDRFGTASGESIYVNLDHAEEFKRLLVFVYIYDGVPAFDRADVVVTLVTADGKNVEIGLTDPVPQARACAVALIEHHKGQLVARREVKYVYGFQSEIDRLYGWGMSWGRGVKPSRQR
ncbi:Tellurium resistance [Streptomyces litchfieldiae]|uniref:Tellurium resistance n=1 Tax=Streptomyces litchfieldiae TaxID=3075543 RepID=A0ABU2MYD3_9ACTN|nr:Tellurium resistance [Streptomyces sp. DSM 44938]MDT0346288.1 Tellurium resistance [Streptomyces sp. DSM 44938]